MSNIKLVRKSDSYTYTFEDNPDKPYNRNDMNIDRSYERYGATKLLKLKEGVKKEKVILNFSIVTENQKTEMKKFEDTEIEFYEDGTTKDFDGYITNEPQYQLFGDDGYYSVTIEIEET